jgi:DNA-binding PadR family transcriptional regulator
MVVMHERDLFNLNPLRANGRFSDFRGAGRGFFHRGHGGGRGGGALRAGRMLTAADLQMILLALLEQRPRHGYDLIKAIQELAGGAYVPSPGMVYPALNYLEELGQVVAQTDGAKKQYRLTDAGVAEVNRNRQRVAVLLDVLKRVGERLGRAQAAFEQPEAHSSRGGAEAPELEAARRDFKAALFDCLDASPQEQQRVAEILRRALNEIRKR